MKSKKRKRRDFIVLTIEIIIKVAIMLGALVAFCWIASAILYLFGVS